MHEEQVIIQMRSMRLSKMAESYEQRTRQGLTRDLNPEEFVAILIEDEYSARKQRKVNRSIQKAQLNPGQACFENMRYSDSRGLSKNEVKPYLSSTWITRGQFVSITGATGTGKTYLAEAIGLRACMLGHSVIKYRYRKLLDEVNTARGTGTYLKLERALERVDVLIIDDFGVNSIEKKQCADLLEIIESKERHGSIVLTSQYPPENWHERLPDKTVADAICDRLIHKSHHFRLEGDTMRKGAQKKE